MPKSLSSSVTSNLWFLIEYSNLLLDLPRCTTRHLNALKGICHFSDHSVRQSKSACSCSQSCSSLTCVNTLMSSANFNSELKVRQGNMLLPFWRIMINMTTVQMITCVQFATKVLLMLLMINNESSLSVPAANLCTHEHCTGLKSEVFQILLNTLQYWLGLPPVPPELCWIAVCTQ